MGLHGKGGDQASNVYLHWVCPGWGQAVHYPFPFLFHQLQETNLGMVVPGPSPTTPPQAHPDRYRREEAEGKEGWGSPL